MASHFLDRFAREMRKPIRGIAPEGETLLRSHAYPGNVRELRNLVEKAAIICSTEQIAPEDIDLQPASPTPGERATGVTPPAGTRDLSKESELTIASFEADLIREALRRTGDNRTRAADLLGISRKQLLSRIRKYDL